MAGHGALPMMRRSTGGGPGRRQRRRAPRVAARLANGRVGRALCLVVLAGVVSPVLVSAGEEASPAAAVTHTGYLTAPDGTSLNYTVVLPSATVPNGGFPTVMVYDGYEAGYAPMTDNHDAPYMNALAADGFAVMGVNMPGTGCSGGSAWPPFSKQWAEDGAYAVTWAASQPWSNGKVGMLGDSFPAFGALWVAAEQPKGLVAIAADGWTGNFYDTVYPGGIYDDGFPDYFDADQESGNLPPVEDAAQSGDLQCPQNFATDQAGRVAGSNGGPPLVFAATLAPQYPYDDGLWTDAIWEPQDAIPSIRVPVLAANSFQDYVVSPSGLDYYSLFDNDKDASGNSQAWFVVTNGVHVTPLGSTTWIDEVVAFLEHYVAGADNGWQNTPHVQVWHETGTTASGDVEPRWVTSYPSWPPGPATTDTLYLGAASTLSPQPPTTSEAPDSYRYPLPAGSTEEPQALVGLPNEPSNPWSLPVPPGGNVVYTTAPLTQDVDVFGPSSLNLWLSSTATDTDVQVTISEVRPDGQEQYIQRGWLRMSMRQLCPGSTPTWPRPCYQKADVQPLAPGVPTYARIPIYPFEHVFRAGSSIRISIEAPVGFTGEFYSFAFNPTPATNTVWHDKGDVSGWVFDSVPVTTPVPPLPACGSVLQEPCRTNTEPVPPGSVTIGATSP
jgi:putative CocE/NonD family hydrolase